MTGSVDRLEMTKRHKSGAAPGAAATAPPQRILGHPTKQGGAHLLLLQVLEVRDPLVALPGGIAKPALPQNSGPSEVETWMLCVKPWRRERCRTRWR